MRPVPFRVLHAAWLFPVVLASSLLWPFAAGAAEPRTDDVEEIVVFGRSDFDGAIVIEPDVPSATGADAAELLEAIPGAAVTRNGPLSGEVQYRGLSGSRVSVRLGGQRLDSGSPNRMDPPLHYAPRSLVERLELRRGVAPVAAGAETVGGAVRVHLHRSRFTEGAAWDWSARGSLGHRSADRSFEAGGMLAAANERFRVHVLGAYEHGDDFEAAVGTVRPTEYERGTEGVGGGLRFETGRGDTALEHALGFDVRQFDTRNAGTPALPMDIDLFDTTLFQADYELRFRELRLVAGVALSRVNHEMDNFRLRTPPAMANLWRGSEADSSGLEYGLKLFAPTLGGELQFGGDVRAARHDQDISAPAMPAFFVRNFHRARRDHRSAFAQWTGPLGDGFDLELGVRYTRLRTDAGSVDGTPARMLAAPRMLRDAFNASDRSRADNHLDWVARLGWRPLDRLRFELAASRKTRSPSYVERYAWLPLEVTAGLADGNNYVGDVGLDPEIFHAFEAGFRFESDVFYVAPRAFYRRAHDYVQGVPATDPRVIGVSTANGDATPLRFANVPAEFHGVDVEWGVHAATWGVALDGTLSWTRGERRDVHDDLYRIAPLTARTRLTVSGRRWSAALENVLRAHQGRVSETNGESSTGSYATFHAFASWRPEDERVRFEFGVENLLDRDVRDHLAGFQRASGGALRPGERLPGRGRSAFGRVHFEF